MKEYEKYLAQRRTSQGRARRRNWLKARVISGIPYGDGEVMTKEEIILIKEIHALRDKLLDKWDENTSILGFKHKKKKDETE